MSRLGNYTKHSFSYVMPTCVGMTGRGGRRVTVTVTGGWVLNHRSARRTAFCPDVERRIPRRDAAVAHDPDLRATT
jgi:hypothetical protein